jgi:magnesium-transporting ATPase (P-type)
MKLTRPAQRWLAAVPKCFGADIRAIMFTGDHFGTVSIG